MKLAINYELKDFKACAEALVQLIGLAPDQAGLLEAAVQHVLRDEAGHGGGRRAGARERQGFIDKPNEIKNLYSVYMMLDLPFKAGLLLQEAHGQEQAAGGRRAISSRSPNAWINARESTRAEATLKKLAADVGQGRLLLQARRHVRRRRTLEGVAATCWKRRLHKGGLKRTGEAWMRLAVAHYG